jgi:hypothetical protein
MAENKTSFMETARLGTGLLMPARYGQLALGAGQLVFGAARGLIQLPRFGTDLPSRLKKELPVNTARIGGQYVGIAHKMKLQPFEHTTDYMALQTEEERDKAALQRDATIIAMKLHGHGLITDAIIAAETEPVVPDEITLQTVRIAKRFDTQPERLVPPGRISEFQAAFVNRVISNAS